MSLSDIHNGIFHKRRDAVAIVQFGFARPIAGSDLSRASFGIKKVAWNKVKREDVTPEIRSQFVAVKKGDN
eukprot:scaffold15315_cov36-Cyclotella_meneghiniana.AAC.7